MKLKHSGTLRLDRGRSSRLVRVGPARFDGGLGRTCFTRITAIEQSVWPGLRRRRRHGVGVVRRRRHPDHAVVFNAHEVALRFIPDTVGLKRKLDTTLYLRLVLDVTVDIVVSQDQRYRVETRLLPRVRIEDAHHLEDPHSPRVKLHCRGFVDAARGLICGADALVIVDVELILKLAKLVDHSANGLIHTKLGGGRVGGEEDELDKFFVILGTGEFHDQCRERDSAHRVYIELLADSRMRASMAPDAHCRVLNGESEDSDAADVVVEGMASMPECLLLVL